MKLMTRSVTLLALVFLSLSCASTSAVKTNDSEVSAKKETNEATRVPSQVNQGFNRLDTLGEGRF
jgi:uncharacterized protein (DUF305 family)